MPGTIWKDSNWGYLIIMRQLLSTPLHLLVIWTPWTSGVKMVPFPASAPWAMPAGSGIVSGRLGGFPGVAIACAFHSRVAIMNIIERCSFRWAFNGKRPRVSSRLVWSYKVGAKTLTYPTIYSQVKQFPRPSTRAYRAGLGTSLVKYSIASVLFGASNQTRSPSKSTSPGLYLGQRLSSIVGAC